MSQSIHLLGYASGIAGSDHRSAEGPIVLQRSSFLINSKMSLKWDALLKPDLQKPKPEAVFEICTRLAELVKSNVDHHQFFTVFGGDHTCAIGTWSGAYSAIRAKGDLGLIWFDAHMDAHTPDSSHTGNIHGMPLASLLGFGDSKLINILVKEVKLKPQNLVLIGVRSYEPEEEELLNKLNVKIYYMDEIKKRGLRNVFAEAIKIVSQHTAAFGVSLDIDGIDPTDAPATGVPEVEGISSSELLQSLPILQGNKHFIGCEIVEFNPFLDIDQKTEKLIPELLAAMV